MSQGPVGVGVASSASSGKAVVIGALGLSLYALTYGMTGPTLPLLGEAFRLDLSQQGALMTAFALGYLASVLFGGYLADRWGKERVMTAGLVVMGAGLTCTGLAYAYTVGLFAFATIGAGGGFVEMTISAIVSERLPKKRGAALNLLQILFGLSAASPLMLTWALRTAGSWRFVYFGLGAAVLALAPVAALIRRRPASSTDRIGLAALSVLYRRPRLWVVAIGQGLYAFAEVSLLSWAVSYLIAVRGESLARANAALSAFWVLFALGRLGCSALSTRVTLDRIVVGLTFGATVTMAAALLVPSGAWSWVLIAASGLFYSGVFGTILAYAGDSYPQYTATVFGLVLATGSSGAVLGPWLIGSIAESSSLTVALAVVALAMFATGGVFVGLGQSRPDELIEAGSDRAEGALAREGDRL